MAFRREMEIGLTAAATAQQRRDSCRYGRAANTQNRKQSCCFWNWNVDGAYIVDLGAGGWSGRARGLGGKIGRTKLICVRNHRKDSN